MLSAYEVQAVRIAPRLLIVLESFIFDAERVGDIASAILLVSEGLSSAELIDRDRNRLSSVGNIVYSVIEMAREMRNGVLLVLNPAAIRLLILETLVTSDRIVSTS